MLWLHCQTKRFSGLLSKNFRPNTGYKLGLVVLGRYSKYGIAIPLVS